MWEHGKNVTIIGLAILSLSTLPLMSCSTINQNAAPKARRKPTIQKDSAPKKYINPNKVKNAKPISVKQSKYGNKPTYCVNDKCYKVLSSAKGYSKVGVASWYGTKFQGKLTSDREIYDPFKMTAASTTLPIPTFVQVTNLTNSRKIIVKVNDRGPFDKNRIIDLSYIAAEKLGFIKDGTARVRVTAIDPKLWQLKHGVPIRVAIG